MRSKRLSGPSSAAPSRLDRGDEPTDHFILPDAAWWNDYYDPMAKRLIGVRAKYRDDAHALAVIAESEREIAVHRVYSDWYGYVFFVMRMTS